MLWLPKVLKDGAAVPAPGAGDALVLLINCNEARLNRGTMATFGTMGEAFQVGRVLGRGGETIRRLEDDGCIEVEEAFGASEALNFPKDDSRARLEIDKGEAWKTRKRVIWWFCDFYKKFHGLTTQRQLGWFILLWTPFQGRLTISGRPESIERAKELVLLEVHPRGWSWIEPHINPWKYVFFFNVNIPCF